MFFKDSCFSIGSFRIHACDILKNRQIYRFSFIKNKHRRFVSNRNQILITNLVYNPLNSCSAYHFLCNALVVLAGFLHKISSLLLFALVLGLFAT